VVDDNSITALREKPFQVCTFWRRYCWIEWYDMILKYVPQGVYFVVCRVVVKGVGDS